MDTFRRTLSYLTNYKWLAIGAFLMMNIGTILSLIVPRFIQQIIDQGIIPKNMDVIIHVSLLFLGVTILRSIVSFFQTFWGQKASQGLAFDIRNDMFTKLEYLEYSFHDKNHIGQLLTRTTNDVEAVRGFFAEGILQIFTALLTLLGSIIILINTNASLFLAVSFIIPVILLVFFLVFRQLSPIFGSIQKNLGQLNNILQENILGIRIVKGFTAEKLEQKRYEKQNDIIYNENLRMVKTFANGFPVVFFLSNIATLIVIWLGGTYVIKEAFSIGNLVAFNSYLTFLIQPIFQLGFILQRFAKANASTKRIFYILDAKPKISSQENAIPFEVGNTGVIEFKGVDFSYIDDESELVLKNINLEIPLGENIAIIGKTGSGKSTLVSLIPRMYDPTNGDVCINGTNVKDFDLESLREKIGVVLQEIRLINGTIRDNITYGNLHATEEEIENVCQIAQVDSFLSKLPNGLDFEVGEGGKNLSGGQRQRIAIARMLLVEPKILILDDATSALDSFTENELIQDAQQYLNSNEYTVIVITQKISTIQNADLIVLIDKGEIIAQGSHEELMICSSAYRQIVNEQNEAAQIDIN